MTKPEQRQVNPPVECSFFVDDFKAHLVSFVRRPVALVVATGTVELDDGSVMSMSIFVKPGVSITRGCNRVVAQLQAPRKLIGVLPV
jgi:hypothetical protein